MSNEPVLTGELRVGAVRFGCGVKLSSAQGCIDRLHARAEQTDEIGWLIESEDGDGVPQWFTLKPGDDWTKDSVAALRFARREDADSYAGLYLDSDGPPCRITEHLWNKTVIGDATHDWGKMIDGVDWLSCKVCGVVRRADRRNNPCKGPVKVGPR